MSSKISALSSVSVAALSHEFLVNESGVSKKVSGTQLQTLFGSAGVGDALSHLYVKADFGAAGDGTTDDTAEFNNAIAAVASHRGQELVLEPGVYLVPNGITETKPGLVVRGIGTRSFGPGQWGDNGVVLKATTPGAWVWTHDAVAGANDYDGGRFENITFRGDADTAGGLLIRKSYCIVERCGSSLHTTGIGFLVQVGQTSGDDASWNIFRDCMSQDDLVGFQSGTSADFVANPSGGTSTEWHHCIANKTGGAGISNTGSGIIIWDNACAVFGGKFENNDIGINVKTLTSGGAGIYGARFEANASYDVALNRASGTSGTRNQVVCRANNILIGAYQVQDFVLYNPSAYGAVVNNAPDASGNIVKGNGADTIPYVSGTPTGGLHGEVRWGPGKIWVNDNGTWKSATVS